MSLRLLLLPALVLGMTSVALAQPAAQPEATPSVPAPLTAAPDQAAPMPAQAAPVPEQAAPMPRAAEPLAPPSAIEPAAPAAPPASAPAPEADAAPDTTPPKKLSVGTEGLFQPGALIQAWYQLDRAAETTNTLKLRRAEISVKGDIIPSRVSYAIMIDLARALEQQPTIVTVANQAPAPGKNDMPEQVTILQPPGSPPGPTTVLQDVFATFQSEYLDASIGQFKIPVGWESNYSTAKQLFAERASISRKYADRRDVGLRLTKAFKYFGYTAGFFNGAGQNRLDNDNGKEGGLRLEAYPVEGMTIAAVGYATLWETDDKNAKARWEIDARYEHAPFLVQAEYIRARDVSKDGAPAVKGQGFYAAAGFYVIDTLQLAARIGHVDPNVDANVDPTMSQGADEYWHFEGGINYYIAKHEAKLMLNYGNYNYQDMKAVNELIFDVQLWY